MKKKIFLFYSSVKSKKQFVRQEYYRTDIKILRGAGHKVILSNRWKDFLAFWKYDCAFIYFYRYGLVPAVFARLFGKQVFFTGGVDYLDRRAASLKQFLVQAVLYNLCGLFATRNILVSSADFSNCERVRYLFPSYRQTICRHSINDELYRTLEKRRKEKLVVTIAWMARRENVIRKGVLESLELFAALRRRDPSFRMLIIGPKGEGSLLVEERIREMRLGDYVSLTGGVSERVKAECLQRAALYFQLSQYEGFGIAAIEALLAECVVVHSGAGGLAEGVGPCGVLWHHGEDLQDLIGRIFLLLDEPSHLKQWTTEGRDHVMARYSSSSRSQEVKRIVDGS